MKELIARFLKNELSDAEKEELNTWLSQDPAHRQQLMEIQQLWTQSAPLRPQYLPETAQAWELLLSQISKGENENLTWRWVLGMAASLLLVGIVVFLWVRNPAGKYTAQTDVRTPMELPDGSTVWLNKGSTLSYQEKPSSRDVVLTGEAYFEVVANPNQPFTILTDELSTQVVGTAFNVDASGDSFTDVVVSSGKVLVFDNQDSVLLLPGLLGHYDQKTGKLSQSRNEDLNFDSWRTGMLVFEDASIDAVISDLESYFDVALILEESADARLNATFDNQSLETILELIALSTDVQISKQ